MKFETEILKTNFQNKFSKQILKTNFKFWKQILNFENKFWIKGLKLFKGFEHYVPYAVEQSHFSKLTTWSAT